MTARFQGMLHSRKPVLVIDNVEESMLNLQRQFESKTVQYIKVNDDGSLVKYISVSKITH